MFGFCYMNQLIKAREHQLSYEKIDSVARRAKH